MLWFILGQIALKSLSLHLHVFYMWYFTRIDDIFQSIQHYRKTTIFILSFSEELILFSLQIHYITLLLKS